MNSDEKIKMLEAEIVRLKEKEKKLEENAKIFKEIFHHLNEQFEEMKKDILKK